MNSRGIPGALHQPHGSCRATPSPPSASWKPHMQCQPQAQVHSETGPSSPPLSPSPHPHPRPPAQWLPSQRPQFLRLSLFYWTSGRRQRHCTLGYSNGTCPFPPLSPRTSVSKGQSVGGVRTAMGRATGLPERLPRWPTARILSLPPLARKASAQQPEEERKQGRVERRRLGF